MVCVATLREDVENVACAEPFKLTPDVRVVAPSRKFTVPLGIPAPPEPAVTVAVKVTAWPDTEGFGEEVRAVVVLTWLTTSVPLPVALSIGLACALTVKEVVPGGVGGPVVMVKVAVFVVSEAAKLNELGLKLALAPAGSGGGVKLSVAVKAPVPVPRLTVMR